MQSEIKFVAVLLDVKFMSVMVLLSLIGQYDFEHESACLFHYWKAGNGYMPSSYTEYWGEQFEWSRMC